MEETEVNLNIEELAGLGSVMLLKKLRQTENLEKRRKVTTQVHEKKVSLYYG